MQDNTVESHKDYSFWRSKLFSLFGVFPLGFYIFVHFLNNLSSLKGEAAFNAMLQDLHALPYWGVIFILVLWVPIAFHGIYGLFIIKTASPNLRTFPYFGNLKYILQRLSGVGLLLFIPAHLYKTRITQGILESHISYAHMVEGFSEWLTVIVYILGILGVSYHLSNGLWQFFIGWGFVGSVKAMKRLEIISILFFVLLASMGLASVWAFVRAGSLLR